MKSFGHFLQNPMTKNPVYNWIPGAHRKYINSRKTSNSFWCEPLKKGARSLLGGEQFEDSLWTSLRQIPGSKEYRWDWTHMKRPFLRRRQFLSYLWYRSWYTWHGTQYVQLVHIMHICILYNYIYINGYVYIHIFMRICIKPPKQYIHDMYTLYIQYICTMICLYINIHMHTIAPMNFQKPRSCA